MKRKKICKKCGDIAPFNVAGFCRNMADHLMDCEYLSDYFRDRYINDQSWREPIYNKSREDCRLERTPTWSNSESIKDFYSECPSGYHVDHIIPLRASLVSGLHVPENLQYLTAHENLVKGNKFNPMEFTT